MTLCVIERQIRIPVETTLQINSEENYMQSLSLLKQRCKLIRDYMEPWWNQDQLNG
jgi:hypothetical protein